MLESITSFLLQRFDTGATYLQGFIVCGMLLAVLIYIFRQIMQYVNHRHDMKAAARRIARQKRIQERQSGLIV